MILTLHDVKYYVLVQAQCQSTLPYSSHFSRRIMSIFRNLTMTLFSIPSKKLEQGIGRSYNAVLRYSSVHDNASVFTFSTLVSITCTLPRQIVRFMPVAIFYVLKR